MFDNSVEEFLSIPGPLQLIAISEDYHSPYFKKVKKLMNSPVLLPVNIKDDAFERTRIFHLSLKKVFDI